MREWVFDATPLIYLATVDRLDVVASSPQPVTTERVYEEVVTDGLAAGHVDARRLERFAEASLHVESVAKTPLFERLQSMSALSDADVSVLIHAAETDGIAVMDERAGRSVADVEDIEVHGTAYLLLSCVERGELSADEATTLLDALLDAGWYCAPNLYAKLTTALARLDD
ncbi:DUF3368 domain-containing protein [Halosegnis rubeus]|uniref:DUF3368 domain-containing protein n=1 Tax=Halosegnis rubeus TaxID=2212850 RepID=A0A5N5UH46_9EURY|nr:DUF3368 domain-containing protein [Halosegnis rubeus]